MKILEKYNNDEIQSKLNESNSFREFLLKIGASTNGSGSYKSIKKQLIELGIQIPEFNYVNKNKIGDKLSDDVIFVENSTYNRQKLKERIIKGNLIEYKCNNCDNNGEWNGNKLSLQLEHINGVNNDNRIENLTFLCPNCHSQTETFSGKKLKKKRFCKCGSEIFKDSVFCIKCNSIKNRKVDRPEIQFLIEEVEEIGYCAVGRKYGVSDNAIRKWIKYGDCNR